MGGGCKPFVYDVMWYRSSLGIEAKEAPSLLAVL